MRSTLAPTHIARIQAFTHKGFYDEGIFIVLSWDLWFKLAVLLALARIWAKLRGKFGLPVGGGACVECPL